MGGSGVRGGPTDLVMKGLEIVSHHGGSITNGLEIPSNPGGVVIKEDHERS